MSKKKQTAPNAELLTPEDIQRVWELFREHDERLASILHRVVELEDSFDEMKRNGTVNGAGDNSSSSTLADIKNMFSQVMSSRKHDDEDDGGGFELVDTGERNMWNEPLYVKRRRSK